MYSLIDSLVRICFIIVCTTTLCVKGNCTSSKECNSGSEQVAICIDTGGNGTCVCNLGYNDTSDDALNCKPIFDKTCNSPDECVGYYSGDMFMCENKLCKCKTGTILHPKTKTCVATPTYVNAACSFNTDCSLIPRTICNETTETCTCASNITFQSSKTKMCRDLPKTWNDDCDFDNQCDFTPNLSCLKNTTSINAWGECGCRIDAIQIDSKCKIKCQGQDNCTETEYCHTNTAISYCEPKKSLWEKCSDINACDNASTSECVGEMCKCRNGFKPDTKNETCIVRTCPTDFVCSVNQFCNRTGECENKKGLGSSCNITAECRGTNTQCNATISSCECKIGYKPNPNVGNGTNVCILRSCVAGDFNCGTDQYCDRSNGACRRLKGLESICTESYECAGFNTRNIACIDRLSNGLKSCYCGNGTVPDRPISDSNVRCIQRIENRQCSGRDMYGILWTALPGETKTRACPGNQQGSVVWQCQSTGYFLGSQPNYDSCKTVWVSQLNETLQNLLGPDNSSIAVENATIFMTEMTGLLDVAFVADSDAAEETEDNGNQFFGHEIQNMVDLVNVVVTKMDAQDIVNATAHYVAVVGEAMAVTEKLLRFTKPWEQLSTMNRTATFANVLQSIETSAIELASRATNSSLTRNECNEDTCIVKTYKQKVFSVTSGTSNSIQLVYPVDSSKRKGKDSFIELPENWQNLNANRFLGNDFVGMEIKEDYVKRNIPSHILNSVESKIESSKQLNSNLMGFQVSNSDYKQGPLEVGSVLITFQHKSDSWGNTPKKIARNLHPGEIPRAAGGTGTCSRFDEEKQVYTTEGCEMVETGPFSTTCKCDRLGKYALQSEFHEYPGKETSLEAVTIVGFGFAILVHGYQFLKSESQPADMQTNMKNFMMVFLMATNILLVAFVDRNYFYLSDFRCYIVGMLTHFVGLCGLMCIATAALHVYMFPNDTTSGNNTETAKDDDEQAKLNASSTPEKKPTENPGRLDAFRKLISDHRTKIYLSFIVGVPIIIGGVTMIVGAVAGDNSRVYGGDFCWLDGPYIWAFFSPVILAVVMNFVLYFAIKRYVDQKVKANPGNEKLKKQEQIRIKCMEQNVAFAALIGLTWAVGYFQLGPTYSDSQFVQYAWPVMAGLQSQIINYYQLKEEEEEEEDDEEKTSSGPAAKLKGLAIKVLAILRGQKKVNKAAVDGDESIEDAVEQASPSNIGIQPSKKYVTNLKVNKDVEEDYYTADEDENNRRQSLLNASNSTKQRKVPQKP